MLFGFENTEKRSGDFSLELLFNLAWIETYKTDKKSNNVHFS